MAKTAKKAAARKPKTAKSAEKNAEAERKDNEAKLAKEDEQRRKAEEKPPVKGDEPKDAKVMKVSASDDALFKALMDDAEPLKRKPVPEQMSMGPPATYAPRGQTPGSLSWAMAFPYVVRLLVAAGLPLKVESLLPLQKRLGTAKWPPLLRQPILDAAGVLEKDPELFKAYADPFVDPNADKDVTVHR